MVQEVRVAELLSIGDLVNRLTGDHPWALHVSQRAFEWNFIRVTNLVDSLLRGFPIGTLIVASVPDPYIELDLSERMRDIHHDSGKARTQIIDGQQRCASIKATFCGEGLPDRDARETVHLWINVSNHNHRYREFDTLRGQRYYFHWSFREQINHLEPNQQRKEKMPPGSPENGWIRFDKLCYHQQSGLWAHDMIAKKAQVAVLDKGQKSVVEELRVALRDAYDIPRIPVHRLSENHDAVEDLHQVFVRINTGGVALSPVDQFFAGVKKYWPDAEEHLQQLVGPESLFGRRKAINVLARCAANSLVEDSFDPTQLSLKDLARAGPSETGNKLVDRMRELAPKKGPSHFVDAVLWVSSLARAKLYLGARSVHAQSLAAVVAWAFRSLQNDPLPSINPGERIDPIVSFLFWNAVWGGRRFGRGRFDKWTFSLAWKAGEEGEKFPYNSKKLQEVCYKYVRVQEHLPLDPHPDNLRDGEENSRRILEATKRKKGMFLSVYQGLEHSPVDWDHILAANYARRRFKKGRRIIRKHFKWVHYIGNFSGIDARANRVLQDKPPSAKLAVNGSKENTYLDDSFIKTDPRITACDIKRLIEIENQLLKKEQEKAGALLQTFVSERSLRIWDEVIKKVGDPPTIIDEQSG